MRKDPTIRSHPCRTNFEPALESEDRPRTNHIKTTQLGYLPVTELSDRAPSLLIDVAAEHPTRTLDLSQRHLQKTRPPLTRLDQGQLNLEQRSDHEPRKARPRANIEPSRPIREAQSLREFHSQNRLEYMWRQILDSLCRGQVHHPTVAKPEFG